MRPGRLALRAAAGLAVAAAAAAAQAGPAHEHGAARLDVAVDGARVSLALEMPLDALLGFERAPRTEAERTAAQAALARLHDGASLFKPDAAARCRLVTATVDAPALQASPGTAAGEHADLDAQYVFDCAAPAALGQLEHGLFDAFARLQRLQVQVAGPKGQSAQTLRRPHKLVKLGR